MSTMPRPTRLDDRPGEHWISSSGAALKNTAASTRAASLPTSALALAPSSATSAASFAVESAVLPDSGVCISWALGEAAARDALTRLGASAQHVRDALKGCEKLHTARLCIWRDDRAFAAHIEYEIGERPISAAERVSLAAGTGATVRTSQPAPGLRLIHADVPGVLRLTLLEECGTDAASAQPTLELLLAASALLSERLMIAGGTADAPTLTVPASREMPK